MRKKINCNFEKIVSIDNLLYAWQEFISGKSNKLDALRFENKLADNILSLHNDLVNYQYKHGSYETFTICDPKLRLIHKANVRDRLLHRAIYRKLYPSFDEIFYSNSFSSRLDKGTHKALNCFTNFSRSASNNNTKTIWILKADIKKFFNNIDHEILLNIIKQYVSDSDSLWLLERNIYSFNNIMGKGLPLGNLTSQLFSNIYLNELDIFIKHKLRAKYYIRYADDFVMFSQNRQQLEFLLIETRQFLENKLKLELHQDKTFIKTLASGVDFLGWIHFPYHRVIRKSTKKRMIMKLSAGRNMSREASYRGLLKHGNTYKLRKSVDLLD